MDKKEDHLTKEVFLGGVLVTLVIIAGFLFQILLDNSKERLETAHKKKIEQTIQQRQATLKVESPGLVTFDRPMNAAQSGFYNNSARVNVPHASEEYILAWASISACEALTYDAESLDQRKGDISRLFTKKGWGEYLSAAQNHRVFENVVAQNQIVTSRPTGPPKILKKEEFDGVYRWTVEVPVVMYYQSNKKRSASKRLVLLTIVRSTIHPHGLAVNEWISQAI